MEIIEKGNCEYQIVKDVSKKTGNEYTAMRLKFGEYVLSTPVFVTPDQVYIIKQNTSKK